MEYEIILRPEAEKDLTEKPRIIILGVIHGRRSPKVMKKRIKGI